MKKLEPDKWNIPNHVLDSLARTILPSIRDYYESAEGKKAFAEWKGKKENLKKGA